LKTSFTGFWRRNLAFFRLAVLTNLEYRFNFLTDAILQPLITGLIELTLWIAIFASATGTTIAGFSKEYYLSYALWAAFVSRITANWMYEYRMIDEIDSGSVNSILVRPMSFFEYYLAQLLGYKSITIFFSFLVPLALTTWMDLPTDFSKLPITLLLIGYYLILVQTMSFLIATIAFHLNRVHSMTIAKNLALWVLSGELFPLDLLPEPYRIWALNLPFANAVYIPVGYLTGRFPIDLVWHGFLTTTCGIAVIGSIAYAIWRRGVSQYAGTGA
jgi:ABC-2 type transport system permease protein